MDSRHEPQSPAAPGRHRLRLLIIAAFIAALPAVAEMQLDLCGCAGFPGLQPFDSAIPATHPPGTTDTGSIVTIPLPEDGILRFSSFRLVNRYLVFTRNALNTPVTMLVAGDFTLLNTGGCCYYIDMLGAAGHSAGSQIAGVGGLGSNGGFRGGDGASQPISGTSIGGTGFGPAGGRGGAPGTCVGAGGQFLGVPELIPLLGGSGGGGGCSTAPSPTSCSGGGGGGGGGAILIAANGTLTIQNYYILADGGNGGSYANSSCSNYGGGGSGGAIRLVASRFAQAGTATLWARAGSQGSPSDGRIRLETVDGSALTTFVGGDPAALRIVGPTPIANPLSPTVRITAINGNAAPAVPLGLAGGIDIVLAAPGAVTIDIATSGVPSGTTVLVTVKPRVGAAPVSQTLPLASCTGAGDCQAAALFNLPAGSYVVEARATFQTPTP